MTGDKQRVSVSKDGPYIVVGQVPLMQLKAIAGSIVGAPDWQDAEALPRRQSYALCRCGRSTMQPFCDYKHFKTRFVGTETAKRGEAALVADRESGASSQATDRSAAAGFAIDDEGRVAGPLWLRGQIEVVAADGFVYPPADPVALCRCGRSTTKPFCDGSHARDAPSRS